MQTFNIKSRFSITAGSSTSPFTPLEIERGNLAKAWASAFPDLLTENTGRRSFQNRVVNWFINIHIRYMKLYVSHNNRLFIQNPNEEKQQKYLTTLYTMQKGAKKLGT